MKTLPLFTNSATDSSERAAFKANYLLIIFNSPRLQQQKYKNVIV